MKGEPTKGTTAGGCGAKRRYKGGQSPSGGKFNRAGITILLHHGEKKKIDSVSGLQAPVITL